MLIIIQTKDDKIPQCNISKKLKNLSLMIAGFARREQLVILDQDEKQEPKAGVRTENSPGSKSSRGLN